MGHDPEDMENERLRGHDHELAQDGDDGGYSIQGLAIAWWT